MARRVVSRQPPYPSRLVMVAIPHAEKGEFSSSTIEKLVGHDGHKELAHCYYNTNPR